MMEAQQKGKGVKEPKEEFKVTTYWEDTQLELYNKHVLSDFGHVYRNAGTKASVEGGGGDSSSVGHRVLAGKKGEKKRMKMEKTISLQDLRQYFAGSLKDAAKSIGVCPTTLKRICRQHGITRWPSRKIKKVGHSLRKLQRVIDTVQGTEGAIQIGSFYSSFPELSSPNFSSNGPSSKSKISNLSMPSEPQLDSNMFIRGAASSKSQSSSSSQSSGSSTCSTGVKQQSTSMNAVEDHGGALKSVLGDAGLHSLNCKSIGEHPNIETGRRNLSTGGALRVKAMFGEAQIQLILQPSWSFIDLQQEMMKSFNIEDIGRIDLKYLDDDDEWVLLTCDADLDECRDIYKSSQSHPIRISLHQSFSSGSSSESRKLIR